MSHPAIYSSEYYERLKLLEERHWWHLGMHNIAATLLRGQLGKRQAVRILDAGCGTGGSLMWQQQFSKADAVIGIDIALDALTLGGSRSGLLSVQASVLDVPFRAASFELVVCQDVLQHLPTDGADVRALEAMFQLLRPGGTILVRANSRLGMRQADTRQDADFQRYALPEMIDRLTTAGFVVKQATYANVLPAVYASLKRWLQQRRRAEQAHHRPVYEGLSMRDTAALHPLLNRLLRLVLAAEACYLSKPSRRLAFGHTTFCLGVKPYAQETLDI